MATLKVIINKLTEYNGKSLYFAFFLLAFIYLAIAEKDKEKRLLFLYLPAALLAVFACPLSAWVSIHFFLDEETYYRQLWLIPYGLIVCYALLHAATHRADKRPGMALIAVSALLLVFVHRFSDNKLHYSRAENAYHIPTEIIALTDYLLNQRGVVEYEYPPRTAFPGELLEYNHQYSADIISAYGRESLISRWGNGHDLLMAINGEKPLKMEELCSLCWEHNIDCFILNHDDEVLGKAEDYGFSYAGAVMQYDVYMIPWMCYNEEHPRP